MLSFFLYNLRQKGRCHLLVSALLGQIKSSHGQEVPPFTLQLAYPALFQVINHGMSGRSREMKRCGGVGVEEGCGTVESVIVKVPLRNYCCWVWCGQQLDFPRHTYLLLCEEDVSVAQLKKKELPLPPEFRLLFCMNHQSLFFTTSQLKGFCPRRRID